MFLLVGLGNPGSDYANTSIILDLKLLMQLICILSYQNKNQNLKVYTTGNIESKIYAIKPLTFMNNSGTAIKELMDYFKIDAKNVFVFHDDMDIDFEKLKQNLEAAAGHNGIESIDKFIGKHYSRVRVGIPSKTKKKVNNHVLEDFKEDEEENQRN